MSVLPGLATVSQGKREQAGVVRQACSAWEEVSEDEGTKQKVGRSSLPLSESLGEVAVARLQVVSQEVGEVVGLRVAVVQGEGELPIVVSS